jgi:hypothetical protein
VHAAFELLNVLLVLYCCAVPQLPYQYEWEELQLV